MIKFYSVSHRLAIGISVGLLILSGILSFVVYSSCPALSAILASISAGCVTGIVFYIISNIRNNDIQKASEKLKEINEYYELANDTMTYCNKLYVANEYHKNDFEQLQKNIDKLQEYWDTMLNESQIPQKLGEEHRNKYSESMAKAIQKTNDIILQSQDTIAEATAEDCLFTDKQFCMETMKILFQPMLDLMRKERYYGKSFL